MTTGTSRDDAPLRRTRVVVGMSGASGAIYGIRVLELLKEVAEVETHLVMSAAARRTIQLETDWDPDDVASLADELHRFGDIAAPLSSGSFKVHGMLIVPCSVKTAGALAWSQGDNLLVRAADVTLKDRRPLVVAIRETPLHLGHLRALTQLAEMGAIIAPLMPAFYSRPATLDEMVGHAAGRLLDLLDIELPVEAVRRWQGPQG